MNNILTDTGSIIAPAKNFIQTQPATNIDEVIAHLELLIHESIENKERIGYFAALYHKVTVRVKDGIQKNEFEDGARMERFDVIFANRFLDAARKWKAGSKIPGPWEVVFLSARKPTRLVLQHLLLGMNAHINLDLGLAAVETVPGNDLESIRKDFNSINDILGSLTFEVMSQLNRVSPLLSLFGFHATNNSILIQFSLTNARDGSWNFAEEINNKKGVDFDSCLAARDVTITKLANALVEIKGLLRFTMWIVYLFEWKNPAKITRVLYEARKGVWHPKEEIEPQRHRGTE